jgi:hypothetical protein
MELLQKLRNKYVASGDLAVVALANGWARQIRLVSSGSFLYVGGGFYFDPMHGVEGFWRLRRRRFAATLSLESQGCWSADGGRTYVRAGDRIEVAVDGGVWLSRPNICATAEETGSGGQVVVHVVGTVPAAAGDAYTAFRCSEFKLPLLNEPLFDRFAFDKRNLRNDTTGQPVEFIDIFVKRGRVAEVLVNPSCEEYVETVRRLYGIRERCRT